MLIEALTRFEQTKLRKEQQKESKEKQAGGKAKDKDAKKGEKKRQRTKQPRKRHPKSKKVKTKMVHQSLRADQAQARNVIVTLSQTPHPCPQYQMQQHHIQQMLTKTDSQWL